MLDTTIALSSLITAIAGISGLFGLYHKIRKIIKDRHKAKELSDAILLQEAKEISNKHKLALEAKIEALSQKINNVEESINKDLVHIKETYNNEVKFLGTQISELKEELRTSLNHVVTLISKLIDKN